MADRGPAKEKQKTPLREHALRLLARRDHSRVELERKLRGFQSGVDPAEVAALLDELATRNLLSDERYAEGRAHVLSRKYGASRVAHELRAKGVSADLVEETSRSARETDLVRAREIWRRKFRSPGTSREDRARQMRFLQARGFSFDVIRAVISTNDEESSAGGDDATG